MIGKRKRTRSNPYITLSDTLFSLIFVLIFMAVAISTHLNISLNKIQSLRQEINELVGDNEELQDARNNLQRAIDEAKLDYENKLQDLRQAINELVGDNEELQDARNNLQRAIDEAKLDYENKLRELLVNLDAQKQEILADQNEIIQLTEDLANERQGNAELLSTVNELEQTIVTLRRRNFLVVSLEWYTAHHDLDLYVIDPQGNIFSYQEKSHEDADGKLTLDNIIGQETKNLDGKDVGEPALEIWIARELEEGTYQVLVGLYACNERENRYVFYKIPCPEATEAFITIEHRDAREAMPGVTFGIDEKYSKPDAKGTGLSPDINKLTKVADVEVHEGQVIISPCYHQQCSHFF